MENDSDLPLTKTGWGPCNYFLIGLSSVCTFAEACAAMAIIVLVPLIMCDYNYTDSEVMEMNAYFSLGMAFGAFFFGVVADANGRKSLIPVTMTVIFCACIFLAFSQMLAFINFSLFLLGLGIASNHILIRLFLIECLPAKRRGASIAYVDISWVVGYIFIFGISWLLVPSVVRTFKYEFRLSSWRVLAGLAGVPTLIMACASSLLPRTPRYLLYRSRKEGALLVLQHMYALNFSRHAKDFPQTLPDIEGWIKPDEIDHERSGVAKFAFQNFTKPARRIRGIFSHPFLYTSLLGIVTWILLFPGLIWMALWNVFILQETTKMNEESPWIGNSTCRINVGAMPIFFINDCHGVNNDTFMLFILISLSYFVGESLLILGIDFIGRRACLMISGLVGSASIVAIIYVHLSTVKIVLSALFLASYAIAVTTINVVILESYPTSVRGTVIGILHTTAHFTGFIVKLCAKAPCIVTIYVVAASMLGATITSLPFPNLAHLPMRE